MRDPKERCGERHRATRLRDATRRGCGGTGRAPRTLICARRIRCGAGRHHHLARRAHFGRAAAIAVAERGAIGVRAGPNADVLDEFGRRVSAPTAVHATRSILRRHRSTSVEHTVKDILGRSRRRRRPGEQRGLVDPASWSNSTERLQRLRAGEWAGQLLRRWCGWCWRCLPDWRERRSATWSTSPAPGAQAGTQTQPYLPTQGGAGRTRSRTWRRQTPSDDIRSTNIQCRWDRDAHDRAVAPAQPGALLDQPERAAAMVVRGLVEKPARITPRWARSPRSVITSRRGRRGILHQPYLGHPDSAAARGVPAEPAAASPAPRKPRRPARPATGGIRTPRPVKRLVRLVPGVHW